MLERHSLRCSWPLPLPSSMRKWRTFFTDADPTSHRVRLWRGGSASSLFFYLFFFSFVEYVDIDALTFLKAPGPYCGAEGEMADLWPDCFSLCLRAVVLSVCSLLLKMFLPCRLIIDPAGSVGPSGTGCDSDWKLVLLQPGPDTQLGGAPSVWSCLFPRVRRLLRSSPLFLLSSPLLSSFPRQWKASILSREGSKPRWPSPSSVSHP